MQDDLSVPRPLRPVAPLPEAPAAASWRRPLLLALLVLVVGAALGAAAFAAEQRAFVWDPDVHAVPDDGWVITDSQGLRPSSPVISGDHLVWGQGAYTCVLELDSGDAHVVGAAPRGSAVWPADAGPRYVAWIEVPRGAVGEGTLWVYDVEIGRRQRYVVGREAATPAVADDLVAWYDEDGDGMPRIETLDMESERRAVLATGANIQYPVLGGDGVVGWVSRAGGRPAVLLHDIASQVQTTVPLAGSGAQIGDLQLAGRTLLWTLTSETGGRVVTFDLDSRATALVARGVITEAATDGETVIWASGESLSGACVVRGLTLVAGDEYEIGRPAAWPSSLAVGSGWAAWVYDLDGVTYLETVRVLR